MKALKSHELDFYSVYFIDPEKIRRRKAFISYFIPAVMLIAALAYIVQAKAAQKVSLERELEYINSCINDPVQSEEYERAMALSGELEIIRSEVTGMEMFGHIKDTYPVIGKKDIMDILECTLEGIRVTSVGFNPVDGTISIQADAQEVTSIPRYIDELKKTGLLVSADYTGYSGNIRKDYFESGELYEYRISVEMKVNPPETDFDFSGNNNDNPEER